ncbi:MAG: RnfH family protein [Rhodocyclaceae bacterium]|jgi:putative ubiquitin-RnfH superfamily antitoxin RatB of RatAB toxin-antitoxin module|nr:RnfH family protein [Rhodocyclaceae bacterium]
MQVSVCYSEPSQQAWLRIEVPEDATAGAAIAQSGILAMFPHIDLEAQKIGVFGKVVKADAPLRPGDRVEIYRAITCDPATVPRRQMEDEEDQG